MLRWFYGHTRRDRAQNKDIRDRIGVAPIKEILVQHRFSTDREKIGSASLKQVKNTENFVKRG